MLSQTLHSLIYLKPSQIAWRAWYMARRRFKPANPTPPPGLSLAQPLSKIPHAPHAPAWDQTTAHELSQGKFTFFDETFYLGKTPLDKLPLDWKLGSQPQHRLWIISLHYHSWLFKLASHALAHPDANTPPSGAGSPAGSKELFESYLDDWLQNASLDAPGSRALAWNTYACATRLSWWARLLWLPGGASLLTPDRHTALAGSIWKHGRFIETNLEYDLRANHLLRDMLGLVYAGRLLQGPDADRWLQTGSLLGLEQVREQLLPDGGHFERSPMYHLHVMEDVLALACLAETPEQRQQFREAWVKMAHALLRMVHPDGLVALFNDAAFNGSETPAQALEAGLHSLSASPDTKPLSPIEVLPHFGIIRLHSPLWTVFFDVGAIGVDYQPGHAHADTLSLEASLAGHRLIVDPGTISYDRGQSRAYDRSTDAHNTVTLDMNNSSEVWDIFRVARRAYPCDISFTNPNHQPTAKASHTGYDRLPGNPRHTRTVKLVENTLQVTDTITGARGHALAGGWLFAPGTTLTVENGDLTIQTPTDTLHVTFVSSEGKITPSPRPAVYHPNFGQEIPTFRAGWTAQLQGDTFTLTTTFTPGPR